jgi:hypothetical protein
MHHNSTRQAYMHRQQWQSKLNETHSTGEIAGGGGAGCPYLAGWHTHVWLAQCRPDRRGSALWTLDLAGGLPDPRSAQEDLGCALHADVMPHGAPAVHARTGNKQKTQLQMRLDVGNKQVTK